MKLDQAKIDQIRIAFGKMGSRGDLLQLLNNAKPLVYGKKAVPFGLRQITWYANPRLAKRRYGVFKIKKKSGADRAIHAPVSGLKSIQKTLSFVLQCVFKPHNAAMGFVREKSIVDNARLHEGSRYVYNIDLKDFFSSIDQARVWKCLQLKPFNLNKQPKVVFNDLEKIDAGYRVFTTEENEKIHYIISENARVTIIEFKGDFNHYKSRILLNNNILSDENKDGVNKEVYNIIFNDASKYIKRFEEERYNKASRLDIANIITSLCCTEIEVERKNEAGDWELVKRNVLPQGAPTSPVITNIVCQRLDHLLSGVARRFGLKYSRYADDITFSSMHNVYQPGSEFLTELQRIIFEQGFHIRESKTRLQKDGYRKEVTGLIVNERANVQQRYIKQLRMWLYYWERYGCEKASEFFLQQYIADKGHVNKGKPDLANVIAGKLDYLKMVKGADNALYQKLKGRFDKLIEFQDPVNKLLTIWEIEGIERAMNIFYNREQHYGKK